MTHGGHKFSANETQLVELSLFSATPLALDQVEPIVKRAGQSWFKHEFEMIVASLKSELGTLHTSTSKMRKQ